MLRNEMGRALGGAASNAGRASTSGKWWAGQGMPEQPESHLPVTALSSRREHPPQQILRAARMAFLRHPSLSPCPPSRICLFSGVSILSIKGTRPPSTSKLRAANTSIGWPGRPHLRVLAAAFAKTPQSCLWAQAGHSRIAKPSITPAVTWKRGNGNFSKKGVGGKGGRKKQKDRQISVVLGGTDMLHTPSLESRVFITRLNLKCGGNIIASPISK